VPTPLPRFPVLSGPTPLQLLPRLRAALGGERRSPAIYIKRDDLAGPALGGNKSRKLEYVIADALAQGATHLITVGAVQSNHARLTAAAARLAGLECILVLTAEQAEPATQGNLLLDALLGAEVHFVEPGPPDDPLAVNPHEEACIAAVSDDLRRQGHRPYVIPSGASVPLGVLGYVDAMRELVGQAEAIGVKPSRLYYAAGSRGTQAGVVLGSVIHHAPWTPHGVAVSPGDPEKTARALRLASGAAELIGSPVTLRAEQIITHQEYYGTAYAVPTPEADAAIRLVARTEGILLDPVYTGKAMSGLLDHVRRGLVPPEETIVFLHTGGVPAVFAQAERLGGERVASRATGIGAGA
jgi:D-cysteine desulfhydrase family pyridoxal phosphate-dependent enzyme